jgi:MSHA pilin protein MshA
MKIKRQGGFTLIELIVVISILGILAAFAIPRFISMETNARASTIRGVAGAIRSASALAHALWVANGSTGTTVTMEGTGVAMTDGYPSIAGIASAVNVSDITVSSGTFNIPSHANAATCKVVYTTAASGGVPGITVTTTDCS